MVAVGAWKQWPWGHFPCPVPAGEEKTMASMCYVAYYPYLCLNLTPSQAVRCFCLGGARGVGKEVRRKMPLERRCIFTWGRGRRGSNVASLGSLPFRLASLRTRFPSASSPVQRLSVRLSCFEVPVLLAVSKVLARVFQCVCHLSCHMLVEGEVSY